VPEPPFTIASDGDDWEKLYWEAFASERFPSYEDFWLAHVVPLTNRATDRLSSDLRIRFRTDADSSSTRHTRSRAATRVGRRFSTRTSSSRASRD
jgi:hypothetical protein